MERTCKTSPEGKRSLFKGRGQKTAAESKLERPFPITAVKMHFSWQLPEGVSPVPFLKRGVHTSSYLKRAQEHTKEMRNMWEVFIPKGRGITAWWHNLWVWEKLLDSFWNAHRSCGAPHLRMPISPDRPALTSLQCLQPYWIDFAFAAHGTSAQPSACASAAAVQWDNTANHYG